MMDIAIFLLNNTVSYSKESSVDKTQLLPTFPRTLLKETPSFRLSKSLEFEGGDLK